LSEHNGDLLALLTASAQKEGIEISGGTDLDPARDLLAKHIQTFRTWLAAGYAGDMTYLHRGAERRAHPEQVLPGAKSVFCVAIPHNRRPIGNGQSGPRFARYTAGADYHDVVNEKLEQIMRRALEQWVQAGNPAFEWKVCVDTSAVLERTWANLCGLGWLGKNSLLIHPQAGSHLFLAEVLLTLELGASPKPLASRCGSCTRCLEACPTQALVRPGCLDSSRCISYWTLEKRGELRLNASDQRAVSTWIAGCDICQEACPFNNKACKGQEEPLPAPSWEELQTETEDVYRARTQRSALNRIRFADFKRNLQITFTNR